MNVEPFLRPHLTGKRFNEHAIPLEFLKDLAVLEEMIVEVAKSKYIAANPGRKRVPCGFTEGIDLRLTGIEEGSAIPVISLVSEEYTTFFPPDNKVYFEKARDDFVCAIDAAEQNENITEHLPNKSLIYFDRIGRSLREGEAMEFTTPSQPTPARLTKETRRILLASSNIKELTEETTVRGTIPEADQDSMTFQIQMIDGRKVKSPMPAQHRETIIAAFNGYETGTRVLIQGIGKFTRQERLISFESIESISTLDPLDVPARLDELRTLNDGWLEGKGIAPSHNELDWLAREFEHNYPDELPLPHVYPTEEGGIVMEWDIISDDISLEIDLIKHHGELHCFIMDTDREETAAFDLNEPEDWIRLVEKIREMNGSAV